MPISFFSEGVSFSLKGKRNIGKWIKNVATGYGWQIGEINFIFCDDDYLLQINQEHLQHDTYTDIITFDYSCNPILEGDIYISIDRVSDNAKDFDQPFQKELSRVLIHGILHLLGFKDKTDAQKKEMRALEEKHIQALDQS